MTSRFRKVDSDWLARGLHISACLDISDVIQDLAPWTAGDTQTVSTLLWTYNPIDFFVVYSSETYVITQTYYNVSESTPFVLIRIQRTVPGGGVVHVSTEDGTATAPEDYIALQFPLTPSQSSPTQFDVPIINNMFPEPTECFMVNFYPPLGDSINSNVTVCIEDDDEPLTTSGHEPSTALVVTSDSPTTVVPTEEPLTTSGHEPSTALVVTSDSPTTVITTEETLTTSGHQPTSEVTSQTPTEVTTSAPESMTDHVSVEDSTTQVAPPKDTPTALILVIVLIGLLIIASIVGILVCLNALMKHRYQAGYISRPYEERRPDTSRNWRNGPIPVFSPTVMPDYDQSGFYDYGDSNRTLFSGRNEDRRMRRLYLVMGHSPYSQQDLDVAGRVVWNPMSY